MWRVWFKFSIVEKTVGLVRMAQWVMGLATKSDDLGSAPGI